MSSKASEYSSVRLASPAFAFLSALFVVPFIWLLWLSLTNLSFAAGGQSPRWIGGSHYVRAFTTDAVFIHSIVRSAAFTVLCVLPELLLGLILAEILYRNMRMARYLTSILVLPALLPGVGVALYWRILLQGEFGLISFCFVRLGFAPGGALLSDARSILLTLCAVDVWQWAPFTAVLFLAVRLTIPERYLEAAMLDGATPSRAYITTTFPLLIPAISVIGLLRAIDLFKEFDKVYILTGGGPGTASELSSLYLWRVAFKYWDFGYAAALSIIVYLALYTITAFAVRGMRTEYSL